MWFIPLLSKVLDIPAMLSAYFNRKLDIDLEKYKVDGQVDETRLKAAIQVLIEEQKTFGGRGMKYIFVYPLGFWWLALIINQITRDFLPYILPAGMKWNVYTVPILDTWGGWIIAYLFLHATLSKR
jgi:hypothetical protein